MGQAALPIFAVASVLGVSEQRKARKQSARANRAQERSAAIQNARAARRSRAQAVQAQASVEAQGVAQGISGSSVTRGISSSIQTQLSSNISFQNQLASLDQARFSALNKQSKALADASTFSAIGQLALGFDK